MQTFLPYENFRKSAECLDTKRLGKQRVEALQILKAIRNKNYGWQKHPAVSMWRGHSITLAVYGMVVCRSWTMRGYKDTCFNKILDELCGDSIEYRDAVIELCGNFYDHQNDMRYQKPLWLGNFHVHSQYRALLLGKDAKHYSQFGWEEEPISGKEFMWPKK